MTNSEQETTIKQQMDAATEGDKKSLQKTAVLLHEVSGLPNFTVGRFLLKNVFSDTVDHLCLIDRLRHVETINERMGLRIDMANVQSKMMKGTSIVSKLVKLTVNP